MKGDKGFGVSRILRFLHLLEEGFLVMMVLGMIFFSVLQILLRNFFESGVIWGDGMVRVMVLWIGLVGAMVATRQKGHIRIDLVSRVLPKNAASFLDLFLNLFASVVCGAVAWFGIDFIAMEYRSGGKAFAFVPAWFCQSIICVAFSVMGLRFLLYAFKDLIQGICGCDGGSGKLP